MTFEGKSRTVIVLGLVTSLFFLVSILWWSFGPRDVGEALHPAYVKAVAIKDIVPLRPDSAVWPVIYEQVPGLKGLTVKQRKEQFIAIMLPTILIIKQQMENDRQHVERLIVKQHREALDKQDSLFLISFMERYQVRHLEALPARLKTHPASLVLAQAAMESGWGTSRFFVEANNVFGVWSFDRAEPRIPASGQRGKKQVYLRKYPDIKASVMDYFMVLARGRSYAQFREARLEGKGPLELLPHLKYYSELRNGYVRKLRSIILKNHLRQYDHYRLERSYVPSGSEKNASLWDMGITG